MISIQNSIYTKIIINFREMLSIDLVVHSFYLVNLI